ncbi:MAG: butyryl-CoA:acetate CoA-transferase, partial [Firmicutes bacterium]|nr:butyryl-CoA:acetate CoA-transferase [Bacillota bacterium]
IVPSLDGSKITSTCTDAYYIVTEYGKVNMMGKSEWQRAEDLIGIAHPDLRDGLIEEAEKLGIWRRTNKR